MSKIYLLGLAAAVVAVGPAYAAGKSDPNKVVCKREVPTGSIMDGKKVCRTRAEWTRIQRYGEDKRSLDAVGRTLNRNTNGGD